jgi:propionyl-CoA carboxylase alpha chain/3-methylcrotonyl-CoA carboxylase alpha subunit/acetyl-CoA/propionyl-CoA carboxylase biotin carboxyl carrier protein
MQIRIAQGEPLPFAQDQINIQGHAIELRIYAEDPENDFMPTTGQILSYSFPHANGIRVDDGLAEGMKVTSAYDPMLAKLIVYGSTRQEALLKAQQAIAETWILGITNNADYLARIIAHPVFVSGLTHTGFIHVHAGDLTLPQLSEQQRQLLVAAVALGSRDINDPEFIVKEPYASMGMWRN